MKKIIRSVLIYQLTTQDENCRQTGLYFFERPKLLKPRKSSLKIKPSRKDSFETTDANNSSCCQQQSEKKVSFESRDEIFEVENWKRFNVDINFAIPPAKKPLCNSNCNPF